MSSGCTLLYSLRMFLFINSEGAMIFLKARWLKIYQSKRRKERCRGFRINESLLRGEEYFIRILSHVRWTPSEVLRISCEKSRSLLKMTSASNRLKATHAAMAKLQTFSKDSPPIMGILWKIIPLSWLAGHLFPTMAT